MVNVWTDAEEVQEAFLLTTILTAMGTTGIVLRLFDPVQVCGHREILSHCCSSLLSLGSVA